MCQACLRAKLLDYMGKCVVRGVVLCCWLAHAHAATSAAMPPMETTASFPELIAFVAAREAAENLKCEAEEFAPAEDVGLCKKLAIPLEGSLRLKSRYSLVLRSGNMYRDHVVHLDINDGRLVENEIEIAFDGSDHYSIDWPMKEGYVYTGGSADHAFVDPLVAYGDRLTTVGTLADLIKWNWEAHRGTEPNSFVIVGIDRKRTADGTYVPLQGVYDCQLTLSPDHDYAPLRVTKQRPVDGVPLQVSKYEVHDLARVGSTWLPTGYNLYWKKRDAVTNELKWVLIRMVKYTPKSCTVGNTFRKCDFQIAFPVDGGYKDERTGQFVGTSWMERSAIARERRRPVLVGAVSLCCVIVLVSCWVHYRRRIATSLMIFVVSMLCGCARSDWPSNDGQEVVQIVGGNRRDVTVDEVTSHIERVVLRNIGDVPAELKAVAPVMQLLVCQVRQDHS